MVEVREGLLTELHSLWCQARLRMLDLCELCSDDLFSVIRMTVPGRIVVVYKYIFGLVIHVRGWSKNE